MIIKEDKEDICSIVNSSYCGVFLSFVLCSWQCEAPEISGRDNGSSSRSLSRVVVGEYRWISIMASQTVSPISTVDVCYILSQTNSLLKYFLDKLISSERTY